MAFSKSPTPQSGKRPTLASCVKVGSYPQSKQFSVRVSADVAEQIGMVPGKRVAFFVGSDEDAGWIALQPTEHPDSTVVLTQPGAKAPHIYITKSRVEAAAKLPAGTAEADFYVHDGALFVRLPQVVEKPVNPFQRRAKSKGNGVAHARAA